MLLGRGERDVEETGEMHIKVVGRRGERAGEGRAREQEGVETMVWGVGGGHGYTFRTEVLVTSEDRKWVCFTVLIFWRKFVCNGVKSNIC